MSISISVPLSIGLSEAQGGWGSMLKKRSEIKLELSEGPYHTEIHRGDWDGGLCVLGKGRGVERSVCVCALV